MPSLAFDFSKTRYRRDSPPPLTTIFVKFTRNRIEHCHLMLNFRYTSRGSSATQARQDPAVTVVLPPLSSGLCGNDVLRGSTLADAAGIKVE